MKKNEIKNHIDWISRNTDIQALRDITDRDDSWLKAVECYGLSVYMICSSSENDLLHTQKRFLCSDIEFALSVLSLTWPQLTIFKVSPNQNKSMPTRYESVSKVYVAEALDKDESQIKFIFQVGHNFYGFEGEINERTLTEYSYVETNLAVIKDHSLAELFNQI